MSEDPTPSTEARRLQGEVWELLRLDRSTEATAIANQQLALLAQDPDDELLAELGDSLMGMASALAWTPRSEQSVADQALSRVATLGRSLVARVAQRLHRAAPAGDSRWQQRLEQALKIDDALIARFDKSVDPELHRIALEARINRCGSLFFLGYVRQAISIFMDLLSRPDRPALHRSPDGPTATNPRWSRRASRR